MKESDWHARGRARIGRRGSKGGYGIREMMEQKKVFMV